MGVETTSSTPDVTVQSTTAALFGGPTPASVTVGPGRATSHSASLVQPTFSQSPPEQTQPVGQPEELLQARELSQLGGGLGQSAVDEQVL
jgi:hypothetical protein